MKVEITLQRMNNFFTLEYSGVKNVLQLNGKVIVDLYKNYKYSGPDLRDFNTSSHPYEHVFYGVASLRCSQQDRNQDQFQEDGEDLEDPIGYL